MILIIFNPYQKIKAFILCLSILLVMASSFSSPMHAFDRDPGTDYELIEYLFQKGETSQTIHEGLRFIYFYPTHPYSDNVRMLMGRSYLKDKNYEKAVDSFKGLAEGGGKQETREEAEVWLLTSLLKQGRYSTARLRCDDFLNRYPDSQLRDKVQYQKAWSYLKESEWDAAKETFVTIDPNSSIYRPARELIHETEKLSRQKTKSPATAGILSAFLPGSGYIYAGKWQTGIAAFIINGVFVGASIEAFDNDLPIIGSIIGIVELGWYSGTVYGSINSTREYNYLTTEETLDLLDQRFTVPLFQAKF